MIYVITVRFDRRNMRVVAARHDFEKARNCARRLAFLADPKFIEQLYPSETGRDGASYFLSNALPGQSFPIVKIEATDEMSAPPDWLVSHMRDLGKEFS